MAMEKDFGSRNNFYEKAENIISQYEKQINNQIFVNKNVNKNKNDIVINRLLYSSLTLAILLFCFMIYDTYFFI